MAVSLPKLRAFGVEAGTKAITEAGLPVTSVVSACVFDLADPASWGATRELLFEGLEIAARLGATSLQTTGGSAGGRAFEWAAEAFATAARPVVEHAGRLGVPLALEPTRPQFAHVAFVHTLRDALALVGPAGLALVVDTAHVWWEPRYLELLVDAVPHLAAVQLADLRFDAHVVERAVPGDGELALGETVATLLDAGYRGPFELEILGPAIEAEGYEPALGRSLAVLRAVLAGAG